MKELLLVLASLGIPCFIAVGMIRDYRRAQVRYRREQESNESFFAYCRNVHKRRKAEKDEIARKEREEDRRLQQMAIDGHRRVMDSTFDLYARMRAHMEKLKCGEIHTRLRRHARARKGTL